MKLRRELKVKKTNGFSGPRLKIPEVKPSQIRNVFGHDHFEASSVEGETSSTAAINVEELIGVGRAGAPERDLPGQMSRASQSRISETGISPIRVSAPGVSGSGEVITR